MKAISYARAQFQIELRLFFWLRIEQKQSFQRKIIEKE
jgi:hypothetical protein